MTTFEEAVENVKKLKKSPDNDELFDLVRSLQTGTFTSFEATVGDNNTPKPGMMDFKGKAKHSAWESKKGMSQDDAKKAYVSKYEELAAKYGVN
ncbi:Acyl-CoA-binding protein [Aphelenchoides besseyi]|nr:Acyl-CoA-binding protein [Aphelenchoides besseyi]